MPGSLCVLSVCRVSRGPIQPAAAGLSAADQRRRGLLLRVPDEDDGVAAHVDETLSLVLVGVFHEHALLHVVGDHGVAAQRGHVRSHHGEHLGDEGVEEPAHAPLLAQ